MPIYEYACDTCRHEFETLVRGHEEPNCPECGSNRLHKLFSVPAAHTGGVRDLPVCETPRAGGCGLPGCGPLGCGM
jgi:putative FmdB family regulatory protein